MIKVTPEAAEDPTVSPDERNRGLKMASTLQMRVLSRMWQMLLTALEEVGRAPNSMMAAEMAIIRLTHVADLPTPTDLIRKLQNTIPLAKAGTDAVTSTGDQVQHTQKKAHKNNSRHMSDKDIVVMLLEEVELDHMPEMWVEELMNALHRDYVLTIE